MSSEREYSYELKRKRRQEIFNERIRNTTRGYYEHYLDMHEEFRRNDFDKFIPDEMNRLESDLDAIERYLVEDPARARNISLSVQGYIYTMRSLGNEAKKRFAAEERAIRERKAKEKSEKQSALEKAFSSKKATISNPAVQNFISNDLERIQNDLTAGKFETVESLDKAFSKALNTAEQKVAEWKAAAVKRNETEISKAKIEAEKERLLTEDIKKEEKDVKIKKLDDILCSSKRPEEIDKELVKLQNEALETAISEDIRREAVKSIIKTLRAQSFTVDPNVQLLPGKDGNFVRIVATMPSGKRAVCNLTDKGKIIYRFDNYKGTTCLKDIQRFNVDLEKVYSVKLSDERIVWSNPDEIGKDADSLPNSNNKINK